MKPKAEKNWHPPPPPSRRISTMATNPCPQPSRGHPHGLRSHLRSGARPSLEGSASPPSAEPADIGDGDGLVEVEVTVDGTPPSLPMLSLRCKDESNEVSFAAFLCASLPLLPMVSLLTSPLKPLSSTVSLASPWAKASFTVWGAHPSSSSSSRSSLATEKKGE